MFLLQIQAYILIFFILTEIPVPHLLQNLFCLAKDQNNLFSGKPVKKQKLRLNFLSTPFAEIYFIYADSHQLIFCQPCVMLAQQSNLS
jgi:hypothetical protein